MAEEIEESDVDGLVPAAVRNAYAAEEAFIAGRVETMRKAGESIIQKALTFVPFIDEVFEEQEPSIGAATSDVNRNIRVQKVIRDIEQGLGSSLDDETKANVRKDVLQMYQDKLDPDEE